MFSHFYWGSYFHFQAMGFYFTYTSSREVKKWHGSIDHIFMLLKLSFITVNLIKLQSDFSLTGSVFVFTQGCHMWNTSRWPEHHILLSLRDQGNKSFSVGIKNSEAARLQLIYNLPKEIFVHTGISEIKAQEYY